ncbi:hypothetical protein F751_5396 [Auxenochlorella protothecoides]|uniref:Uncharacterized protein n=1 Tax=Auxenochlorella protothecoides TaxID=3075 RepID=A0A087SQ27_AUXPR|nr:hypothetical protein F751_5396 [Auxenochlorella protothecoides]KFM27831.1 hypothetical protein F751_5396 [Auxenochlorella protothecoides]
MTSGQVWRSIAGNSTILLRGSQPAPPLSVRSSAAQRQEATQAPRWIMGPSGPRARPATRAATLPRNLTT